jgi:hypothetical protein
MTAINKEVGVGVNTLKLNDEVLVYDYKESKHYIDVISSIESIKRPTLVLLLELEEPNHLFMASKERNGAIVSHNNKPIFTDVPGFYEAIGGGTSENFGWSNHYSPEN